MNPLTPYMLWIKLGGALLVCAGCFFAGGYTVHDHMTAKYNKEKLQTEADQKSAILKKVAENDALLASQRATHAKEIQDYGTRLDRTNAQLAADRAAIAASGGLRVSRTICDQPAGAPETADAGRSDGANQATLQLPTRIETGLLTLTGRADTEMNVCEAKLEMCQHFARDNGFAP